MPEEHKEDIKSVEGKIRELMKSKMKLNNGEKKLDEKYIKQIKINMIFNNMKQQNFLRTMFIS